MTLRASYDFSHGRRNPYARLLPAARGPFNRRELAMGIQVEREHTRDRATARRIATHHLSECPRYYTLLRAMEKTCAKNPGQVIQAGPGPFMENAVLRKLQQTMYEATGTWATLEELRPVAIRALHAAAAKQKQSQFRVVEGGRRANPPDAPVTAPARIGKVRKQLVAMSAVGRVYLVDGAAIRARFPEFIGGGHPAVYRFVPKGEIWLEKALGVEAAFLFAHEALELLLMHWKRLGYDRAHELSNRIEGDLRLSMAHAGKPQFAKLPWSVRVERLAANAFLRHLTFHFPQGEMAHRLKLAAQLAGTFRRLL